MNHTKRLDEERIPKQVMYGRSEGTRRNGCQSIRCKDDIKKYIKPMGLWNCITEKWKKSE